MFSKKTRKGLLGGVALALAGLMAGEAGAAGAVIINDSFCDSPAVPSALAWVEQSPGLRFDNLLYMKDNGELVPIRGNVEGLHGIKPLQNIERIFIASHGGCGKTGTVDNEDFARSLRDAGLRGNPELMITTSCYSAQKGLDQRSLLKSLQVEFPDAREIIGSWGAAALSTIGHGVLRNAVLADSPVLFVPNMNGGREKHARLQRRFSEGWTNADPQSAASYCALFEGEILNGDYVEARQTFGEFVMRFRNFYVQPDNLAGQLFSYNLPVRSLVRCGADVVDNPTNSEYRYCP